MRSSSSSSARNSHHHQARPPLPRPSTTTSSGGGGSAGLRPKTVDQWCADSERTKKILSSPSLMSTTTTTTTTPRPPSSHHHHNKNNNNMINISDLRSKASTLSTSLPGVSQTGNNKSAESLQKQLEPIGTISNASIFNSTTRTTISLKTSKTQILDSVAADKHPPEDLVPPHLRPFVASDAYRTIMHKFEQQRALFASSVVCAETAFREVLDATAGDAKKGRPDPIRSAVACGLLKRLLPPAKESASARLLHQLVGEMARAIFDVGDRGGENGKDASDESTRQRILRKKIRKEKKLKQYIANVECGHSELNQCHSSSDEDYYVGGDGEGGDNDNDNDAAYQDLLDANIETNQNSYLLDQEPFDQLMLRPLYFQQVATVRDDLYLSRAAEKRLRETIKKQSVILDHSIDRWQQMLVRRVFTVWKKHTIQYRPKNFEGRFRMLATAKSKQLISNCFTGWRYVVTATNLNKRDEEVHYLKLELARSQMLAAKQEKELRNEIAALMETSEALQGTIVSLKEDISNISDQVEEERRRGDIAVQMGDKWRETCLKIVTSLSTGKRSTHRYKNAAANSSSAASLMKPSSSKHGGHHHHHNQNQSSIGNLEGGAGMAALMKQLFGSADGENNILRNNNLASLVDVGTTTSGQLSSNNPAELFLMPEEVLPVSFDFDMSVLQKAVVDTKMAKELGLLSSNQHQEQQELEQAKNNNDINNNPYSLLATSNEDGTISGSNTLSRASSMATTTGMSRTKSLALTSLTDTRKNAAAAEATAALLVAIQRQIPSAVLRNPISTDFIFRAPLVLSGLEELHGLMPIDKNLAGITSHHIVHTIEDRETGEKKYLAISPDSNAHHNPFHVLLRNIEERVREMTARDSQAVSPIFAQLAGMTEESSETPDQDGGILNNTFSSTSNEITNNNNTFSSFRTNTTTSGGSPVLNDTFTKISNNTNASLTGSGNTPLQLMIMKQLAESPAQTLLLAWINSMCQQSPLVKRLVDTKHYHFEHQGKSGGGDSSSSQQHFTTTTLVGMLKTPTSTGNTKMTAKSKKAIVNEMQRVTNRCSLGDAAILNQIIGTAPCLPTIDLPVRNFGVNFSSGDILLFLAESLGTLSLQDLRQRYNVKELQTKAQQQKEQFELEKTLAMTAKTGAKHGGGTTSSSSVMSCHPIVGRILRARVTDVAASSGITSLAVAEHELLLDALFAIIVLHDVWDKVDLALRCLHDVFIDAQSTEFFLDLHRNNIMEGLAPTDLRVFLCKLFSAYADSGVNPNIGMAEVLMSVVGGGGKATNNNNNNNKNDDSTDQLQSTASRAKKKNKIKLSSSGPKKRIIKVTKKKINHHGIETEYEEEQEVEDDDSGDDLQSSEGTSSSDDDDDDRLAEQARAAMQQRLLFNNVAEQKRKPLTLIAAPYLALAKERRNFQAQSWLCRLSNAVAQEATSPTPLFPLSLADSGPEIEELLMKCVASRVSRCQQWRDKWKFVSSLVNDKFKKEDEEAELAETDSLNGYLMNNQTNVGRRTNNTNHTTTNNSAQPLSTETLRELNLLSLTHDQSLEAVVKRFEQQYNLQLDNSQGRAFLMGGTNNNNNMKKSSRSGSPMGSPNSNKTTTLDALAKSARQSHSMAKSSRKQSLMVLSGGGGAASFRKSTNSEISQATIALSNEEVIRQNKTKIRKLEWPTFQVMYPMMQRILHYNSTSATATSSSTTTAPSRQQQQQQQNQRTQHHQKNNPQFQASVNPQQQTSHDQDDDEQEDSMMSKAPFSLPRTMSASQFFEASTPNSNNTRPSASSNNLDLGQQQTTTSSPSTSTFDRKIRRIFYSYATRSVASSVAGKSVSVGVHYGISHSSFREFIVANGFHVKPANSGLSKRALGALYDLLIGTRVMAREKGETSATKQQANERNLNSDLVGGGADGGAPGIMLDLPGDSNAAEVSKLSALERKKSVSFNLVIEDDQGNVTPKAKTRIREDEHHPNPNASNNKSNNLLLGGSNVSGAASTRSLSAGSRNDHQMAASSSNITILTNIKPLNNARDDLDLPPGQLSLGDFSATICYIACSLAFADNKKSFTSDLVLNHLKNVVENLRGRPSTRRVERDAFQQSVDAFDVQAVFELHNNALRRAFLKAAAADGDPEMSIDEFMFVMRTTRLQVVVGTDSLKDIFSRFAGGAEGSLLYRDFLDCLCVISLYCDPSPFTPLSEKVSKLIKGPIAERSLPGLLSSMGVKSVH